MDILLDKYFKKKAELERKRTELQNRLGVHRLEAGEIVYDRPEVQEEFWTRVGEVSRQLKSVESELANLSIT